MSNPCIRCKKETNILDTPSYCSVDCIKAEAKEYKDTAAELSKRLASTKKREITATDLAGMWLCVPDIPNRKCFIREVDSEMGWVLYDTAHVPVDVLRKECYLFSSNQHADMSVWHTIDYMETWYD
jgi:hypothetical protein